MNMNTPVCIYKYLMQRSAGAGKHPVIQKVAKFYKYLRENKTEIYESFSVDYIIIKN